MQRDLEAEKIAEIKSHFEFFDADHNGIIDIDEFTELMNIISPESKQAEIQSGFNFIDSNDDNQIDWDEFIEWWNLNWCQFLAE
ncbi:MAG: EF-hand domain-containing protein [bacterium]